jgi:hypothetical protein
MAIPVLASNLPEQLLAVTILKGEKYSCIIFLNSGTLSFCFAFRIFGLLSGGSNEQKAPD